MRQRDGQEERGSSSRSGICSQRVDARLQEQSLSSEEGAVQLIPGLLSALQKIPLLLKCRTGRRPLSWMHTEDQPRHPSVRQLKTSLRDDTSGARTTDQEDETMRSTSLCLHTSSLNSTHCEAKKQSFTLTD